MPEIPKMPGASSSSAKKHTLTLAQLSSYDDMLTDALVDRAWYWTTIPKNRTSYHPSRGVKEDEISKLIQTHLIVSPNVDLAEEKLLATDGLRRFYNALKTPKEKADFTQHLRRYMQIYLPDCPFEVSSTNRYTVTTHEASIVARRPIKRNETIRYLSGIQVVITPEEEEVLSSRKKDFSIVVSSRNRLTSLFMGPARFANHDCGANAKLVITGQAGIDIVAIRRIDVGEEITVTYGENYFGEDNCECLCQTCENNLANGWKQPDGVVPVKKSIEDDLLALQGYNTRGRNRYGRGESTSRTPSLAPDLRPRVLKGKLKQLRASDRASTTESSLAGGSETTSRRKRGRDSLATPPVTPSKKQKTTQYEIRPIPSLVADRSGSSDAESGGLLSRSNSSNGEAVLTDATTPEDTTDLADVPSEPAQVAQAIENLKQEQDAGETAPGGLRQVALFPEPASVQRPSVPLLSTPQPPPKARGLSIHDILNTPSEAATPEGRTPIDKFAAAFGSQSSAKPGSSNGGQQAENRQSVSAGEPVSPSPVITQDPEQAVDSVEALGAAGTPAKRGRGRPRKHPKPDASPVRETPAILPTLADPEEEPNDHDSPAPSSGPVTYREPGDYQLTPRLLAEPDMAWVRCSNCTTAFVQQNAYYTRSSCPRCERHSKLYGYMWPKTQPEGPWDKEERVLDHRTVHRFLATSDELVVRGRSTHTQSQTGTPRRDESEVTTKRGRGRPPKRSSLAEDGRSTGPDLESDTAELDIRRSGRARKASFKVGTC
ncbi:histone lysine methyltransferase Set9 [Diaporthe australafricana]|uniref:Histone-lysine N-methyltransferase SET9 n=1 Tax=Diaporthe australafricana TaxID=127596 RepID=A0ABR3XPE9_9PEZI